MSGPKISIGIDDSVQAQVKQLDSALKEARKNVRELEKEAKKALESTGKVSEFTLRRIDEAKRRANDVKSQLRGARSLAMPEIRQGIPSNSIESLSDLKNLADGASAFKSFRGGIRGAIGSTSIGQSASAFLSRPGVMGAVRGVGVAGAYGMAAVAAARGLIGGYDRNFEGERMEDRIRLDEMQGKDTSLQRMELERQKIGKMSGLNAIRGAGASLPIIGGVLTSTADFLEGGIAFAKGLGDADMARAKYNKVLEGMSAEQAQKFHERNKQEVDGNAITTTIMDKVKQMLPDAVYKLVSGNREKGITEQAIKNLAESKSLEAMGYKLVDQNNFAAADESFKQSADKAGKNKSMDSVEAWREQEASMQAKISFHQSVSKVPSYRVGL